MATMVSGTNMSSGMTSPRESAQEVRRLIAVMQADPGDDRTKAVCAVRAVTAEIEYLVAALLVEKRRLEGKRDDAASLSEIVAVDSLIGLLPMIRQHWRLASSENGAKKAYACQYTLEAFQLLFPTR